MRFTSALRTILPRYWVTDEMVTNHRGSLAALELETRIYKENE